MWTRELEPSLRTLNGSVAGRWAETRLGGSRWWEVAALYG